MATLSYQQYIFSLRCTEEITFSSMPAFIFRSVLGNQLKRMSCLFRGRKCGDCSLKKSCVYSFLFESPIDKDDVMLKGRNRAPHPFTLFSPTRMQTSLNSVELLVTLFGKGIEYFPYLFFALKRAGEQGIFKKRIPFAIESVSCQGRELIIDDDNVDTTVKPMEWAVPATKEGSGETELISIRVSLLSPLRIKYGGKYGSDFSYIDFINSIQRRAAILASYYGNYLSFGHTKESLGRQTAITERNLTWQDFSYFSSRQQDRLRMGGVLGSFDIEGHVTPFEKSLLHGAEIFHAGKNPVFGFGKIAIDNGAEA